MNTAYKRTLRKVSANSVKVVHVAPASPMRFGPHALANLDFVINALRLVGTVPSDTYTIVGFLSRLVSANEKKDYLGHRFLEIYLNKTLTTSARIKSHITEALDT